MAWKNILKPYLPQGKENKQDVTIEEISEAIGVTDAILKDVSKSWTIDVDKWRMHLFPIVLEWMND